MTSPMTYEKDKGNTVPYRPMFPTIHSRVGSGAWKPPVGQGPSRQERIASRVRVRGVTLKAPSGGIRLQKLARKWQCREPEPEIRERARRPTVSVLQAGVCAYIFHPSLRCVPFGSSVGRQLNRRGTGHANRPVRLTQVPSQQHCHGQLAAALGVLAGLPLFRSRFLKVLLLATREGSQPQHIQAEGTHCISFSYFYCRREVHSRRCMPGPGLTWK